MLLELKLKAKKTQERLRSLTGKKRHNRKVYARSSKMVSAKVLLILFAIALAVKLPFAMFLSLPPGDDIDYYNSSVNLVQKGFYSIDGVTPNLRRPFTYPLLLSASHLLFGVSPTVPLYLQAALSAMEAVLLFIFVNSIFNRMSAIVAYLYLLLFPAFNLHIPTLLSENAGFLLIIAFIFLFFRQDDQRSTWRDILCGIAAGMLVYTRSSFVIILPALAMVYIFSSNKIIRRRAVITVAILAIIMNAWAIRNYTLSGQYSYFGIEGGATAYIGSRLEFDGRWVGWPTVLENGSLWSRDKKLQEMVLKYPTEIERMPIYKVEFMATLRDHPLELGGLMLKKIVTRVWFPPYAYNFLVEDYVWGTGYDLSGYRFLVTFLANIYYLVWIASLLLAVIGFWESKLDSLAVFSLSLLVMHTLLFAFLEPIPRHSVTLLPIVFIYSSLGAFSIWSRIKACFS